MRILMLGNSFTYFNDMPEFLAALTGWEVVSHTRGGAYLSEHLDPQAELGKKTLPALQNEKWDVVVLQDQSRAPFTHPESFMESMRKLCSLSRQAGAVPLLYATWAYREGSQKLAETGMNYTEMFTALYNGYHAAAQENHALIADVGKAFFDARHTHDLYASDDFHPSGDGSALAAQTIAACIREHLVNP